MGGKFHVTASSRPIEAPAGFDRCIFAILFFPALQVLVLVCAK